MNRVEHARYPERPAPTAQQRHAQRQLISLLNVIHVDAAARGASLRLTQQTTELPTWLDILGIPYHVTTVRRRANDKGGALDVAIMLAWADLSVLARWAPGGAGRIEAMHPPRSAARHQPAPATGQ